MFKEVPIARGLRLAFGGGLAGMALIATPTFAQTTPASDTVQQGERVEVTGSSIKRIDAETALPVQIITRQDISRLAPQNVEDLLRTISASSPTGATQISTGSFATTSGISSISLRGLGAKRTLVLVNGRRIAPFGGVAGGGGVSAVDVNSIPIAAIERVEILKDGASAIYGSDAVAGVVNFILRSDYVGAIGEAQFGTTTHSGSGKSYQSDVVLGFGDLQKDRFNVMLTASYNHEDAIYGKDRYFAQSSINLTEGSDGSSGNTYPANIVSSAGSSRNFLAPAFAGRFPTFGFTNCAPSIPASPIFVGNALATSCRYDPAPSVALIPQSTRTAVGISGRFAITPDMQAYGELNASRNIVKYTIQATPISDQFALTPTNPYVPQLNALIDSNLAALTAAYGASFVAGLRTQTTFLLPTSSIYYPTAFAASLGLAGSPIDLRYRSIESGGRSLRDENTASRGVFGVKGSAYNWDYDLGVMYTQSQVKESLLDGYPQYSKLLPLLNSGVVNPFGPSTPAVLAQIKAANYTGNAFESKTSLAGVDGHASREVYNLPAGPITFAFGGDFRKEKYSFAASAAAQSGDLSGYGGNFLGVSAQRNTEAAFMEVNVPIVKGLEMDAAYRYDNYEGVANTTNPKVSLRWQPVKEFLLRSSWGTGFRAPALDELFAPVVSGVSASGLSDPARCVFLPNGGVVGSSTDCLTQFNLATGGNTHLTPEKSVSKSIGFQIEPTANVHFGADYFDTFLRNQIVIGGVSAGFILANAANLAQFSNLVTRGANGSITSISQQNTNLGNAHVQGWDVDGRVRFPTDVLGRFTVGINGTYFTRFDSQNTDGSYTGGIGNAGAIGSLVARWRHIATAAWDYGPWSAQLTDNFQSGYQDFFSSVGNPRKVGVYETFDVQGSYSGIKGLTLTAGIKNFLDKDPPYSNAGVNGQFQAGYDASYADVRGRFIYGKVSYEFK
jgi:iron complex outermembrane recepter protein